MRRLNLNLNLGLNLNLSPRFAFLCLLLLCACGPPLTLDRDLHDLPGSPSEARAAEPSPLRITVIDVGQGDAILVEAPDGHALLVDAGPPGAGSGAILPLLAQRGLASLTTIVLTHFHDDHTGGLAEVLAGPDGLPGTPDDIHIEGGIYERDRSVDEGAEPSGAVDLPAGIPRRTAAAGDRIDLGAVDVEVVASGARVAGGTSVDPGEPPDENALGVALLISYRGFRMLLEADITGGGGDPPYQTPDIETPLAPLVGDVDVLKVAHHGSQTSTNQTFLDATRPEVAIISLGDGNDYGHPHAAVIDRLLAAGIAIFQTERGWLDRDGPLVANGNVVVEVDEEGSARITTE